MTKFTPQWGSWFAGFTASNGLFSIDKGINQNPRDNYRCKFELGCHPVDRPILTGIQDIIELGSIIEEPVTINGDYTGRFQTRFEVDVIEECTEIIELFETYPLRTQKQDTFDIWKEAVIQQSKPIDARDPLMLDYYFTVLQEKEKQSAPEPASKPHAKKTSLRLYEITDAILNRYTDDDDIDQSIEELETWDAAFDHKIGACAAVVKNLIAEADACNEEAHRLSEKATAIDNKVTSLKDYMKRNMEFVEKTKVSAGVFTVRIQKSPLSIEIKDENRVPDKYKWEFKELRFRKKSIADYVRATGEIPAGIEVHQKTHIRIA